MMKTVIRTWVFSSKSAFKGKALAGIAFVLLHLVAAPAPLRRDICALFSRADTFRAMQALLWIVNRSYLKFGAAGLGYPIGNAISDSARRALIDSRFLSSASDLYDRIFLAFSGLQAAPDSPFWKHRYDIEMSEWEQVKASGIVLQKKPRAAKHYLSSQSDALSALRDVSQLFQSVGLEPFLVSGTLLGLVREGCFLGHDYDIDLGCYEQGFDTKEFLDAVHSSPTLYIKEISYLLDSDPASGDFSVSNKPLIVKLLHSSYVTIDVFIHYQFDDRVIHGSSLKMWFNSPFTLRHYNFLGLDILGPKDFDRYLTENYGDWRTEKKDYNCDVDTPNIVFPYTPPAEVYIYQNGLAEGVKRLRITV